MEMMEKVLEALRRTHFGLSVSAVGVFLLAIPTGPDFEAGLAQLRTLEAVLGEDGYTRRCAQLVGEQYADLWASAREYASVNPGPDLPPSARFGGFAMCPMPSGASTIEAVGDFLTTAETAEFAFLGPAELMEALAHPRVGDGAILSVTIQHAEAPDTTTARVPVGLDTVDVDVIEAGWVPESRNALELQVRTSTPGGFAFTGIDTRGRPGSVTRSSTPLDWLSETEWGLGALADSTGGELTVLQHLQPFWPELGSYSRGEAARYLQARADDQQGSVEVLGMNLDASFVVWGGPMLMLALLSHLLVHLQHLDRLAPKDREALAAFPWVALFPGATAALLRVFSLLLLPAAACAAVALRAWPVLPVATAWSVLALLGCLALSISILRLLRRFPA